MNLSSDQKNKIGSEFLDKYLETGFGIMTKTNLEVLLFYLMQKGGCFNGMTNFKISKELRVSEERVAKLSYSAQLLYAEHNDDDERLRKILSKAQPKNEGKKIQFSIEDSYLRKLFRSKIKEKNQFSDGSFLADIVTIDIDAYIELIEDLFYSDSKTKNSLVEQCKKAMPKELLSQYPEGDITFHWMLKTTLESACKEVGKVGVDGIATLINGVTLGKNAVEVIKRIFEKLRN